MSPAVVLMASFLASHTSTDMTLLSKATEYQDSYILKIESNNSIVKKKFVKE